MQFRILWAAVWLFFGTLVFAQTNPNDNTSAAAGQSSSSTSGGAAVSAPRVLLIIARPAGTAKSRQDESSWIGAFTHEYLFFRLRAINQIQVYDPDTLLSRIADYRSYDRGPVPDNQYQSAAENLRATHILNTEYELINSNASVKFSFSIEEPVTGGGRVTKVKSAACSIAKIDEELDASINKVISALAIEPDQYGAKFLKTKISGSGKCNKEIGTQITDLYKDKKPNYRKAAEELKKCALQEEGAFLAYYISAQEYAKAGDYENAAGELKDLILKLGPSYPALYPITARYFRKCEQPENALKIIKVCLGLGLSTNDLVMEEATLYEAMEDEDNATKAYQEVLAFDPTNFNALLFLMCQYNKLNDPKRALAYATQFSQAYPSDGRGELQKGIANLKLQQNSQAQAALTRAADLLPNDPAVHTMLGDLDIQSNKSGDALQQYERALELKGEDVDLYVKVGQTHLLMGNPSLALEKLKGIRKKNYDNMALLKVIGLCESQTGDAASARTDLTRYVEYGPPDRAAYLALGELEELDKQYTKAMDLYQKAGRVDPNDPAVKQHIEALKQKAGEGLLAGGEEKHVDETAYAPRRVSPRFVIGTLSGLACVGGIAGGIVMDRLVKKDYTSYQVEENTGNVNTLHKRIQQNMLYRNVLYGLAGASGVGLTLTIVIPSKQ